MRKNINVARMGRDVSRQFAKFGELCEEFGKEELKVYNPFLIIFGGKKSALVSFLQHLGQFFVQAQ